MANLELSNKTPRLTKCRTRTTYEQIDARKNTWKGKTYVVAHLRDTVTGFEYLWSVDIDHKDSMDSLANYIEAMTTNKSRDGTKRVRCVSYPDRKRDWEVFTWTPYTPEPLPPKTPIEDLLGI
jgi:hypothetical protein